MAVSISREELHRRVWSEPVSRLSQSLGLSDVGLAKACRRHGIPVPPRGYWAKRDAGKAPPAPDFNADDRPGQQLLRFPGPKPPAQPAADPPEVDPEIERELDPANAIVVADRVRVRHPLLVSTREFWRMRKRRGFRWDCVIPPHFNIAISEPLETRALSILQTLFGALSDRGHRVDLDERGGIRLTVQGETCGLVLRERMRQARTVRTPATAAAAAQDRLRPHDLVPTGQLEIRLDQRWGKAHVWRDCEKYRVEDILNLVAVGLIKVARAEKEWRAARERERLAALEAERKRVAADRQRRQHLHDIAQFEALQVAASRHLELHAFMSGLKEAIGPFEPESPIADWLARADEHVESLNVLDRFRESAPSIELYFLSTPYEADRVLQDGFRSLEASYGDGDAKVACVTFTDALLEYRYGGSTSLSIELPELDALPYEVLHTRETYRTFRLPEDMANRFPRRIVTGLAKG